MTTSDGRVRLYRMIQKIATGLDRHNAISGIGVIVMFGNVTQPFPDISVTLEGMAQLTDEVVALTIDDLVIPDHLRLTRGDRIALLPVHGDSGLKFLVQCKVRTADRTPPELLRAGYDGDMGSGEFIGISISVTGQNESDDSSIDVYGDDIRITSRGGASVTIDGINFKHHTHPGGGGPV